MFDTFVGNSMWHLVKQADFLSKGVLLILFIMSVICWTVFICKLILLRLRKRSIQKVHDMLQTVRSIDDLVTIGSQFHGTLPGRLISSSVVVLHTLLEVQPSQMARNWEIMQYHIDQTADTLIASEESYLPILSTNAGVAPLLGLFGTVWGLIHAFVRISEKQSADITVVAPGIAEALITTLAGLIVAIPAFVMYNYLVTRVRHTEVHINQLADRVSFIVQQALTGK